VPTSKNQNMKKISFDEELYKKISVNDLIIFAVHSINIKGEKCTFERLVKECFTFFPKVFYLSQYQKWPDCRKLDRPLRTLRKRKLIAGNPKISFSLTKQGSKIALEIAETFRQKRLL